MLPTVQAVPQEPLAPAPLAIKAKPVAEPKPVPKPKPKKVAKPKTYTLPPPPKPPQIIAQQGPELLSKDRPREQHSRSLSPRSFARNARSKKDSPKEIEDFIILDEES